MKKDASYELRATSFTRKGGSLARSSRLEARSFCPRESAEKKFGCEEATAKGEI
jgi:hypothetical protein